MNEALNEKYGRAILKAQRAGDTEAAESLQQDLARMQTGEGNVGARVGAGMMDVAKNVGNVLGVTSDQELAEQNKFASMADPGGWGRMGGQAIALAPAALIPGAATIPGAIASGAGIGAVMSPEDRLKGAAIGGATGGVAQYGMSRLPRALSAIGRGAKEQIATRTPWAKGTKQELAERAFKEGTDNVDEAINQLTSYSGPPRELPGFRQTTAAITGDTGQLATERALREGAFGDFGAPVRATTAEQNAAVRDALERTMAGRAAPAADEAARFGKQAFETDIPSAFKAGSFQSTPEAFKRTFSTLDAALDNAVGAEKNKLMTLRNQLQEAILTAHRTGDSRPLAVFRRQSIKDELAKMFRDAEGATSTVVRQKLQPIKEAFDAELNKFTAGEWKPAMQGYAQRAMERGQAEAGENLLEKSLYTAKPDSTGALRTDKLQTALEREFGAGMTPTDAYGSLKYSPQATGVLRKTMEELQRAKAPYAPDIAARGSATAQNLTASGNVLKQAMNAQKGAAELTGSDALTAAAGFMMGGPLTAAVFGVAKQMGLDRMKAAATADIARRLVQMYVDPNKAVDVLIKSTMPQAEKAFAVQLIQQRLVPSLAQGAAASTAMSMPVLENVQR